MKVKSMKIWHNPRCGKSRDALKYLEAEGEMPEIVKYLDTPPTVEELRNVLELLGMAPRDLMRTKEKIYKELDLKNEQDDQKLIEAMVANPKLIERPVILTDDGQALLGRPLQNVEAYMKARS
jgi:arsenate reductase